MSEEILDHFSDFEDQFEAGTKIVVAKYFYFESEARLYAARLKEAGIKSFISNANIISVMPLGEGGIGLHIKEDDLPSALPIIRKMDQRNTRDETDLSYHDADKEDIAYEKSISLQRQSSRKIKPAVIVVLAIVILMILINALLNSLSVF
ncbi:MAG: hypothetical protein AAF990_17985 [Bacteroidota bacterium]